MGCDGIAGSNEGMSEVSSWAVVCVVNMLGMVTFDVSPK